MNKIVIDGQWKQVRTQVKEQRGKVRGDNLGRATGEFDRLVSVLQEKYGYSRERAASELKRRLVKHAAHDKAR